MLKFFELNSIRHRMLSGFLFLTLLIFIIGSVSVYVLDQVSQMAHTHSQINRLQVYTLNLIKTDNDFFDFEVTNEHYFTHRQSAFLQVRDSLQKLLDINLKEAKARSEAKGYPFSSHLRAADSLSDLYHKKFAELEALVYERGFKDFGVEGKMREHAHELENFNEEISLADVLSLRRHEKDFLLRHDTVYRTQFNTIADRLIETLSNRTSENSAAIDHLKFYQLYFNQRVQQELRLGLHSGEGLRKEMNQLTTQLSGQYFLLTQYAAELYTDLQRKARIAYILITAAAIAFSLISGLWISKKLSEPIAKLSRLANSATGQNPDKTSDLALTNAAVEINDLTGSFIKLMNQTNKQMREIEQKSAQLKKQNEELNKLNTELDSFLYSAAHDLRSPLTSLLGIIRLMKLENQQPDLLNYLEMMEGSIQRQEDFISQIVNYAKNNKLEVVPEPIDLKTTLLEIFQNHEFVPGAGEIEKFIHVRDDASFFSDKNRIYIIFNNLVSNAIRYADPSKKERYIQIKIHVRPEEAEIEFSDNGVGIGEEHLGKIFNMFYRASFQSKGSGLGLFIFKEAIHKLNGLVTVESELHVGTRFFIRLPNLATQAELPLAEVAARA